MSPGNIKRKMEHSIPTIRAILQMIPRRGISQVKMLCLVVSDFTRSSAMALDGLRIMAFGRNLRVYTELCGHHINEWQDFYQTVDTP